MLTWELPGSGLDGVLREDRQADGHSRAQIRTIRFDDDHAAMRGHDAPTGIESQTETGSATATRPVCSLKAIED